MTDDTTYICVDCGAEIPERDDGFLQTVCGGCGGVGFVTESDYVEYFEKPVSDPPRVERPHCEFVMGTETVTAQDELGGWIQADEFVHLEDCV